MDELELLITRVFDAPRARVWQAWADPEQMKQWSAPRGFTIPVSDVYREVIEPERMVFTHAWDDQNGKPGPETLVTVTFIERGGKTEMNFRQTGFDSAGERDGHAGGWSECFDRLDEILA